MVANLTSEKGAAIFQTSIRMIWEQQWYLSEQVRFIVTEKHFLLLI